MERSETKTGILMITSKKSNQLMQIKYLFYDIKMPFNFFVALLESTPETAYPDRDLLLV